jgi:serine/threonine protein kinase
MLLDFGATQAAYADNRPLGPHTLTLGFAPLEQHRRGHVGPWTDVYALGATIYACMNGKAPPPSPRRAEKDSYKPATRVFARRYSRPLCEMVDWCLHMDQVRRPQSVEELIDLFNQPFTAGAEEEPATTLLDRLGLKLPWPRR